MQLDPQTIKAREAAQVRRLITADNPVIVLCVAPHLTDKFEGSNTEYERIVTPSVPAVAAE